MRAPTKKHLNEQDFRLIREMIKVKWRKTYTTEYVRKVYNGERKNNLIFHEIAHYKQLRKEFECKLMEKEGRLCPN